MLESNAEEFKKLETMKNSTKFIYFTFAVFQPLLSVCKDKEMCPFQSRQRVVIGEDFIEHIAVKIAGVIVVNNGFTLFFITGQRMKNSRTHHQNNKKTRCNIQQTINKGPVFNCPNWLWPADAQCL